MGVTTAVPQPYSACLLDRFQDRSYSRRRCQNRRLDGFALERGLDLRAASARNPDGQEPLFRSSIAGRFDNYDGSGTQARINWDLKFARGGVGAIISSNAPVDERGRIVPGYATSTGRQIPFWRELGGRVHEHDCKLHPPARLRRPPARHPGHRVTERRWARPTSRSRSTASSASADGRRRSREIVARFAQAARRAREAGLDGVELARRERHAHHAVPLARRSTTAKDEYGGSLENRARFVLEIVRAIRAEVGRDFHLGFKISVDEATRELLPWLRRGNTVEDVVQSAAGSRRPASTASTSRRQRLPASAQPGRRLPGEGRRSTLRHAALERLAHVPQLPPLPHLAAQRGLPLVVGAAEPPARNRGHQPPRRARGQGGRLDPGALHRRLPDRVGDRGGDRARRLRRRHDRAAARRQPRPRRASSSRGTTARRARARTATSASSTSSRTRSAATRRAASTPARRWCGRSSPSTSRAVRCEMRSARAIPVALRPLKLRGAGLGLAQRAP